jgi:hypothetical protein
MRLILTFCLAVLTAAGNRYEITVAIDPAAGIIHGTTRLTYTNDTPRLSTASPSCAVELCRASSAPTEPSGNWCAMNISSCSAPFSTGRSRRPTR